MAQEKTLAKQLQAHCKKERIFCTKLASPSNRGMPDYFLADGMHIYLIELKHPDQRGKLSPLQVCRIDCLRMHGVMVFVLDDLEMIKIIVGLIKNDKLQEARAFYDRNSREKLYRSRAFSAVCS